MVTWIPSIYPFYVSIYTSTMDPMGTYNISKSDDNLEVNWQLPRGCINFDLKIPGRAPKLTFTCNHWSEYMIYIYIYGTSKIHGLVINMSSICHQFSHVSRALRNPIFSDRDLSATGATGETHVLAAHRSGSGEPVRMAKIYR